MKKLRLLLIPFLVLVLSTNVFAMAASDGSEVVFDGGEETVVVTFAEGSSLSQEQRLRIADRLVNGAPEETGVQPRAWCWLTGHDYTYDVVLVTTHKKSAYSPRCYEEAYNVETCTKCDHMSEEWVTGVYIVCCPEE